MINLTPLNPSTGEQIALVPSTLPEEVQAKVKLARAAQKLWSERPVRARTASLKKLRGILAEDQGPYSRLITQETGKTSVDALTGEILPSLLWIDYVCRHAPALLRPRKISTGWIFSHESTITFDPLGVVGIITPWNFPVYITLSSAVAALAAGNAVLTKPSHLTPLSILRLEAMMVEAEIPSGLFQVIPGRAETGQALIKAGVDKIVFTGSVQTGKSISVACAQRLIPCTLELGGKDPMIVLDDAPMPRTVHGALYAGLCHAGQICMSVERIYVMEPIAREFLEQLTLELKKLRPGKDISPLQSEEQFFKVKAQVDEAVRMGATVLVGQEGPAGGGYYYPPTLLLNVPESSRLHFEESFGPLFYVKIVKSEEEAVRMANASSYGLTASVWSTDVRRAQKVARQVEAGGVFINDHLTPAGNPHAPWGGVKESGLGTQRGEWGIMSMVRVRHMARSRFLFSKDLFWFPRTEKQERIARGLIQGLYSGSLWGRIKGLASALRAFSKLKDAENG